MSVILYLLGTKDSFIFRDNTINETTSVFCRKVTKPSAEECDCVEHLTAIDIKNNYVPVFVLLESSDLAQ
jgi:hypothetical protein